MTEAPKFEVPAELRGMAERGIQRILTHNEYSIALERANLIIHHPSPIITSLLMPALLSTPIRLGEATMGWKCS